MAATQDSAIRADIGLVSRARRGPFCWHYEVRSNDPSERPAEFKEALAAFKHEHGEILEAHWCTHQRAAEELSR